MWHYPRASRTRPRSGAGHGIAFFPGPRRCGSMRAGRRLPIPLSSRLRHARHVAHIMSTGTTTPGSPQPGASSSASSPVRLRAEPRPDGPEPAGTATGTCCGAPHPVEEFKTRARIPRRGNNLRLVDAMNDAGRQASISLADLEQDGAGPRPPDRQRLRQGRRDNGDTRRASLHRRPADRVARPHRLLDPAAGPLIAVRLWILTRKTLGGVQTI